MAGLGRELILRVLSPIFFTAMIVLLVYLWCRLWRKINSPRLELIAAAIAAVGAVLFMVFCDLGRVEMGTGVLLNILHVSVTVVTIWAIAYLKLGYADFLILAAALLLLKKLTAYLDFQQSMMLLGGSLILTLIIRRRYQELKKSALFSMISIILAAFSYCAFDLLTKSPIITFYYVNAYRYQMGRGAKLIFLCVIAGVFLTAFVLFLYLLKKWLHVYFDRIQEFSNKYEEIGSYLLLMPFIFGLVLLLLDGINFFHLYIMEGADLKLPMTAVFVTVLLGTQLFYIRMLMQTVRLKEHLEYQEQEQINLQLYNKDLNDNMQEIRAMKHDIKNVFLTMGEFVRRSEDEQLKDYYYTNIAPFADNEIKMNDIYMRLQGLQNESLKAFFYYKIVQGIEQNVEMELETSLDHSYFPYCTDVSIFIRIAGIFIDNAIESVMQSKAGSVEINIREKESKMCITIKNPVEPATRQSGIYAGTTSKGLGRGNGLNIVKRLVGKHNDILWNSYFQGELFVQSITVEKT